MNSIRKCSIAKMISERKKIGFFLIGYLIIISLSFTGLFSFSQRDYRWDQDNHDLDLLASQSTDINITDGEKFFQEESVFFSLFIYDCNGYVYVVEMDGIIVDFGNIDSPVFQLLHRINTQELGNINYQISIYSSYPIPDYNDYILQVTFTVAIERSPSYWLQVGLYTVAFVGSVSFTAITYRHVKKDSNHKHRKQQIQNMQESEKTDITELHMQDSFLSQDVLYSMAKRIETLKNNVFIDVDDLEVSDFFEPLKHTKFR